MDCRLLHAFLRCRLIHDPFPSRAINDVVTPLPVYSRAFRFSFFLVKHFLGTVSPNNAFGFLINEANLSHHTVKQTKKKRVLVGKGCLRWRFLLHMSALLHCLHTSFSFAEDSVTLCFLSEMTCRPCPNRNALREETECGIDPLHRYPAASFPSSTGLRETLPPSSCMLTSHNMQMTPACRPSRQVWVH